MYKRSILIFLLLTSIAWSQGVPPRNQEVAARARHAETIAAMSLYDNDPGGDQIKDGEKVFCIETGSWYVYRDADVQTPDGTTVIDGGANYPGNYLVLTISGAGNHATNVSRYAPDKTGVTDATAAFQSAVDAGNGTIFVPKGIYLVEGLEPNATTGDLIIHGDGDQTVLQGDGTIGSDCIFLDDTTQPANAVVSLHNLRATNYDEVIAQPKEHSHELVITIDDCSFDNCFNAVRARGNVVAATILDSTFTDMVTTTGQASGLELGTLEDDTFEDTAGKFIIRNNRFTNIESGDDTETHAIWVAGIHAEISGNVIDGIGGVEATYIDGLEAIYTKCRYANVHHNTIIDGGVGAGAITIKGLVRGDTATSSALGYGCEVAHNVIIGKTAGKHMNGIYSATGETHIHHNRIEGLRYITGHTVNGAAIYLPTQGASDASNRQVIENNQIYDCKIQAQIWTKVTGNDLRITDNVIDQAEAAVDESTYGILVQPNGNTSGTIVRGNTIRFVDSPIEANYWGVRFVGGAGDTTTGLRIEGNTVFLNAAAATGATTCYQINDNATQTFTDTRIANNTAEGTYEDGDYVLAGTPGTKTGWVTYGNSWQDDLLRVVTPEQYGADPTGVLDSSVQIQACFDANPTAEIHFQPGGTYLLDTWTLANGPDNDAKSALILGPQHDGISIRGNGATLKVADDIDNAEPTIYALVIHSLNSEITDMRIDGLKINGNQSNQSLATVVPPFGVIESGNGYRIKGLHVSNCEVWDGQTGFGVFATEFHFSNCYAHDNNFHGFRFNRRNAERTECTGNQLISRNNGTASGGSGIDWSGDAAITFDVVFTNATDLWSVSTSQHGLVDGDRIQLTTSGTLPTGFSTSTDYYVVAATTTTFQLASTVGGAPILSGDDGTGTHSVEFEDQVMYGAFTNVVIENSGQGSKVQGNWDLNITGIHVNGSLAEPAFKIADAKRLSIDGFTVSGGFTDGFNITTTATDVSLSNGTIASNDGWGIIATGSGTTSLTNVNVEQLKIDKSTCISHGGTGNLIGKNVSCITDDNTTYPVRGSTTGDVKWDDLTISTPYVYSYFLEGTGGRFLNRINVDKPIIMNDDGRRVIQNSDMASAGATDNIRGSGDTPVVELLEVRNADPNTNIEFVYVEDLRPEHFGAVGNGVIDDTTAMSSAITAANGKPIYLRDGAIYRINTTGTYSEDVHFVGPGTLLIDAASAGAVRGMTFTGTSVIFDGVTIDGGDVATAYLSIQIANPDLVAKFTNCTFQNISGNSVDTAAPLTIVAHDTVDIVNCTFQDISAVGNTTVGDSPGAVRGIYSTGTGNHLNIESCIFKNINTVDGGSNTIQEDADAIDCANIRHRNVSVSNCVFENVGKRAVKFNSVGPLTETITLTNTTNLINSTATEFVDDERVMIELDGGTLPGELDTVTTYYVINQNANDLQLSLTEGGAAVTFSGDGTATINLVRVDVPVLSFTDSRITSNWTRDDLVGSSDNGMWSAVSAFGGDVIVSNVDISGGPSLYHTVLSSDRVGSASISNCDHNPMPSEFVEGSSTNFVLVDATTNDGMQVDVNNNRASGVLRGMQATSNCSVVGNTFDVIKTGVWLTSERAVVANNTMTQSAYKAVDGYGVLVSDVAAAHVLIDANTIVGLRDLVNDGLADTNDGRSLTITNNVLRDATRRHLFTSNADTYGRRVLRGNQTEHTGGSGTTTTPPVGYTEELRMENVGAKTVTRFDTSSPRQPLRLYGDGFTTLEHESGTVADELKLRDGADVLLEDGYVLDLVLSADGMWHEVSRNFEPNTGSGTEYGEIWLQNSTGVVQSFGGIDREKITAFATDGPSSAGTTPNAGSDQIDFDTAGTYKVTVTGDASCDTATVVPFDISITDAALDLSQSWDIDFITTGDQYRFAHTMYIDGILDTDDVSVYANVDADITFYNIHLTVQKVD